MNALEYHRATKHTPESVRRNSVPLDWANMPDPFRHYESTPLIDLPADPLSPPLTALSVLGGVLGSPSGEDTVTFLSRLLFYSASISASKKTLSGYRYALRVNPSSGNLHPTEFHLASPLGIFHYRVSSHMLEQRAIGDFGELSFLLTTISWREAWKYGNRAYRYCLLDAGHAWQALALSARALGCEARATGRFTDDDVAAHYSLPEDEWPLLLVSLKRHLNASTSGCHREWIRGIPNKLSEETAGYPAITSVHSSTKLTVDVPEARGRVPACVSKPLSGMEYGGLFGEVVRRRRSALDFRGGSETMATEQLLIMLGLATRALAADFLANSYVDLYVYVHRVRGIDPGVYRYLRVSNRLELLKLGDQRTAAAGLSLGQDLAGNSCVAISMVADLEKAMADAGDRGYRYVHFEAGAIGQRLYLAADALGLQSTGIGAFYDDLVNEYLGLKLAEKQVVYHFACGYAVKDHRLAPKVDGRDHEV